MLNLDSMFGSFVVVLFILGLITGLAVCVMLLSSRIWREAPHEVEARRVRRPAEAPSFKKAA